MRTAGVNLSLDDTGAVAQADRDQASETPAAAPATTPPAGAAPSPGPPLSGGATPTPPPQGSPTRTTTKTSVGMRRRFEQ